MSILESSPVPITHQHRQVGHWKKLLYAALVCLAFFALVELTLWAFGVATLIEQEDPFRGFSGLVTVFDAAGDVYQTRRGSQGTFNNQSFLAKKPANGLRIFCLGGSSSHGFPWGADVAFTGIVGEALSASHAELRVEAVNASGVSYAMHRLNIVADELLDYQPDVFIVYSGHNEFIERSFYEALARRSAIRNRLEYLFSHWRLYSSMRETFRYLTDEAESISENFRVHVRRDQTRVFSLEEKEAIVAEYRRGLERLVVQAQAAGVKVVLVTVPANLRQWRPEASTGVAMLSEADRQKWSDEYRSGKRLLNAGQFAAATASLEQAARLAPGHSETQFLLAQAYEKAGRWDDARAAYRRACDADASPIRRTSGINTAIRQVAQQETTLLVDADRVFEQSSEHGLVGLNLIEDYVHPTREGHEIIAWHIWDAMERAGWFGSKTPAKRGIFDTLIAQRRSRPDTNNTNAVWLFKQGGLLANQGNAEAAIEKYRQALALSPDFQGAMLNLGAMLNRTGTYTKAVGILQRLIELDPESAEARNNLGIALVGLGRFEEALAQYQEALRLKPDFADANNNLGIALQELGRVDEALVHYQEALRLKPDYAQAQYNWGHALQGMGRFEEALTHYQQALWINPDFAEAHNNWGVVLQRQGRFEEALVHFKEAAQIKPDYKNAQYNWGLGLQSLGHFEEAIDHYRVALRIQPDYAEAQNSWGNVLAGLDRIDEALVHYQAAVRINPDYPKAHNRLATTLAAKGRFKESLVHYQEALRIQPDFAEAHYNLGVVLNVLGRSEEALMHYQKALRLQPDYAKAHYHLGVTLEALGRGEEALEHYQVALRIKPDYATARDRQGTALEALGRFEEALALYDDAARRSPKDVTAVNNLAWLLATCPLAEVRDGKRAIQLAGPLVKLQGTTRFTLLDTLAAAHAEQGDFEQAVRWQEEAVQLAPEQQKDELRKRLDIYRQGKPFRQAPMKQAKEQ